MERRYTKSHSWIEVDGDVATVGITDYAQSELGDVAFVELPVVGGALNKGERFAVVESVKTASEVYAPLSGTVVELNADLEKTPSLVNTDAEGKGWFIKMTSANFDELASFMSKDEYEAYLKGVQQ